MSLSPKRKKINPDGVAFEVDLERFTVGTSMFIPCIDTKKAVRQLRKIAKLNPEQIEHRVVIEGDKYGVRIWRVI